MEVSDGRPRRLGLVVAVRLGSLCRQDRPGLGLLYHPALVITVLDLSFWDMISGGRGPAHLTYVEQRRKCTDPGLTSPTPAYRESVWGKANRCDRAMLRLNVSLRCGERLMGDDAFALTAF